jgi:hypothetical protein
MVNLNYPQEKENDETTTPDQINVENSTNGGNIEVCKVDTVKVLVYALSCALIYPSVE